MIRLPSRLLIFMLLTSAIWWGGAAPVGAQVPVLVIDGKGHGHGVGMPQDGALAMARSGSTVEQILARFYPGTTLSRKGAAVRVMIAQAGGTTGEFLLAFPDGGEVRGSGTPLRLGRGGRARLSFDGSSYRTEALSGAASGEVSAAQVETEPDDPRSVTTTSTSNTSSTTTPAAPSPPSTPPSEGSSQPSSSQSLRAAPTGGGVVVLEARGRQYRGVIDIVSSAGKLRAINEVDVEEYLRGMGEVRNPNWPQAGLQAQAVVARTYAIRAALGGQRPGGFHLYDDQRSQVYLGRQVEYAAMDTAISRTNGRVVVFNGSLAATVYSSSAGGVTASALEGFGPGAGDRPYLKAAPYETPDPRPWSVSISLEDVGRRFAYSGTVTGVTVTQKGPSGRAMKIRIDGSAGAREVEGVTFDAKLGLKSTLFTLRGGNAATAPTPPPPAAVGAVFQELLDDNSVIVNASDALNSRQPRQTPVGKVPGANEPKPTVGTVTPRSGRSLLMNTLGAIGLLGGLMAVAHTVAVWQSPYLALVSRRGRSSIARSIRRAGRNRAGRSSDNEGQPPTPRPRSRI